MENSVNQLPSVSIVMCCYNGERYINRAFTSILDQTYRNIELVFVNDGSTDNSLSVAQSYSDAFSAKGFRLRIFSHDNMGFVKSCFTGIRKTTGDYLTLLDVDDWITPDAIELKADFLTRNPSFNIVRSNGVIVPDSDIDAVQSVLVERESEKTNQNIFFDLLFGRTNNYSGTYMIRSRPFFEFYKDKEIPCGQRGQYGQNLQLLLPLSLDAPSGFIDKCLFKYVRVQGSHSNQQNLDRLIDLQLGYWDIRYKMLDLMGIYDNKLRDDLRAVNYSNILNIILGYGDVERYNSYYDRLRELGRCTLEQKMYHSKLNKRPTYLFYRALFKMSRMARRHI